MPLYNYSDTAQATTLSTGINSSVTSMTVVSATSFPAVPFKLTIDPTLSTQEHVLVTSVSGNTLTIIRGVAGSTAVAHLSGVVIAHEITAEDFLIGGGQGGLVFAQLAADVSVSTQTTATLSLNTAVSDSGWSLASSNTQLVPPPETVGRWWKMSISARTTAPPAWRYLDGRTTSTTGTTLRMCAATAPAVGSSAAEYDLISVSQPFQILSTTGYFTLTMNASAATTFLAQHFAATGVSAVTQPAATWLMLESLR